MTTWYMKLTGGTPQGDEWQFGLHVTNTGLAVADVLAAWSTAASLLWSGDGEDVAGIGSLYDSATTVGDAVVLSLDPATGKGTAKGVEALSLAGTNEGDPLPPKVALVVSKRTAVPTRAGRGRIFLPAPSVNNDQAGSLSSDTTAAVIAAVQAMSLSLVASELTQVIYHAATRTTTPMTSWDVGNQWDTMTSRGSHLVETRTSYTIA
jgi:hypothetical protein